MILAADVALILGAFGAAGTVLGTTIGLLVYRRDRPRLTIDWSADEILPTFEVHVVNDGRQPIALWNVFIEDWRAPRRVRIWFRLKPLARIGRWLMPEDAASIVVRPAEEIEAPMRLEPGEHYTCTFEARHILQLARGDRTCWIVARPLAGRPAFEHVTPGLLEVLETSARGR